MGDEVNMFGTLVAILEVTVIYHVNYIEGRHSIAYVLVPLTPETATRMDLKPNASEIFLPCSNCFFKFDRHHDQLIQYYNRPAFGERIQRCGCFEYLKKVFTNLKEPALITVSENIIKIDTGIYYGLQFFEVMKTDQCRLDSIRSTHTVNGLQLALLIRCS
uniref:Phospholipid scramblase n=1 Tax=Elaeophora elaphi TaxID=1147741 RepID=A0A0R3RUI8_9BILA